MNAIVYLRLSDMGNSADIGVKGVALAIRRKGVHPGNADIGHRCQYFLYIGSCAHTAPSLKATGIVQVGISYGED